MITTYPAWLAPVGMILFFCGVTLGVIAERARSGGSADPRAAICARAQAILVADTLCVRPDSSWRVR